MNAQPTRGWQKRIWGCGILLLTLLLVGIALLALAIRQDLQAVHYPGAAITSEEVAYDLPHQVEWNYAYFTTDPFAEVHDWYSTRFALTPGRITLGGCELLHGESFTWVVVTRRMHVMVCNTFTGQMITVKRSLELR